MCGSGGAGGSSKCDTDGVRDSDHNDGVIDSDHNDGACLCDVKQNQVI